MVSSNDQCCGKLKFDPTSLVGAALLEVAGFGNSSHDQSTSSPSLLPSRTENLLHKIIRGEPSLSTDENSSSQQSSTLVPAVLAEELAVVHAYGVWAHSFLPLTAHDGVRGRFELLIREQCAKYLVEPHFAEDRFEGAECVKVFANSMHARHAVLQTALSSRYGSLEKAPNSYPLAGVPLVLFAHESRQADGNEGNRDKLASQCEAYRGWESLAKGRAVFDFVGLTNEESARHTVASKLRQAVKERRAPVLVVLYAGAAGTICGAANVLRAVCDKYGVHFHVEGEALALLLAGRATKAIMYDAAELLRSAHSALLPFAEWFGWHSPAVPLYLLRKEQEDAGDQSGCDELGENETNPLHPSGNELFELSAVMALWLLLDRVQLPRRVSIFKAFFEHTGALVDMLCGIPSLIEVHSVGCGANIFISYDSVVADCETRTSVNRAMLWLVAECHPEMSSACSMATRESCEWFLLSPIKLLRSDKSDIPPCNQTIIERMCCTLVRVARTYELVLKGRAAFIADLRQCKDVEVETLPLLNSKPNSYPLFFAALRITPYGEVSRNGHWIKDEDMRSKVQRMTARLGELLQRSNSSIMAMLGESPKPETSVPVVLVGPKLAHNENPQDASVDESSCYRHDGRQRRYGHQSLCAQLAEEWKYSESLAQTKAMEAAGAVTDVITSVLTAKDELTGHGNETSEESKPENTSQKPSTTTTDLAGARDLSNGEAAHADDISGRDAINGEVPRVSDSSIVEEGRSEDVTGNVNTGKFDNEVTRSPSHSELDDAHRGPGAVNDASSETSQPTPRLNPETASEQKLSKKIGIWRLIFGGVDGDDDGDSSHSVASLEALEEDYFRP